jgi:thiamine pyrophosphate-dependent acetolactate synthase large subunit-like protein
VREFASEPLVRRLIDDHPLATGCAGVLGTPASREALRSADTVLVVGSNYPYRRDAADPGAVSAVHLDISLSRIASQGPNDVPLVGDPVRPSRRCCRKQDRGFLELARHGMAAWRERLLELEQPAGEAVRPGFLVRTIDRLASDDAVLCSDPGPTATWSARHFEVRGQRGYLVSANLAGMPSGLPYAVAAQSSHPGRQCLALVGSEGFTTCGALGLRVEAAGQLEEAVVRALDHDGPVLVDVLVDPAEQPQRAIRGG